MKTAYTKTFDSDSYHYKYYKCTIDEHISKWNEHYIGYEKPDGFVRAHNTSVSDGITSVSLDSIMDAYNDYKMACEF